jgi:restriction system protein
MRYGGTGEGAAHALGKTGDNGIDGVIDQNPLGIDKIYTQDIHYAEGNNIEAGDNREFFGASNLKRAQKGTFITTLSTTSSEIQTAKGLGMRIVPINDKELVKLMLHYNIGSRDEQVLHLKNR